ncbi:MAG TPA: hypothetical protein EYP85_07655 [Armatimonadetes bacterium]|nr:hypothetical protein [Armatimonadota bacterium]
MRPWWLSLEVVAAMGGLTLAATASPPGEITVDEARLAAAQQAVAALERRLKAELEEITGAGLASPCTARESPKEDLLTHTLAFYQALVRGQAHRRMLPSEETPPEGFIVAAGVDVRPQPDRQHPRHAVAAKGAPVSLLDHREGWLKVAFANGTVGWVEARAVRLTPAEPSRQKPSPPERTPPLVAEAHRYQGVPYRWGGHDPTGFDCSGLIQYLARKYGREVPHSAAELSRLGQPVDRTELQPGDLVFFQNTYKPGVSHVGIYVGEGRFIHASPRAGVTVSRLDAPYYRQHYAGARRLLTPAKWAAGGEGFRSAPRRVAAPLGFARRRGR